VKEKGFCEVYEAEDTVEREGREKRVGWELENGWIFQHFDPIFFFFMP
jgi:hypothetical protein